MGLSQALRPSWIQLHLNLEASQQEQLILQLQSLNEVLGCKRMTMGLKQICKPGPKHRAPYREEKSCSLTFFTSQNQSL